MYCSTMAAVPMLSWMNATRSFSFSSLSTTDACEMPIDASCVSDLTISGNGRRFGRRIGRPMRNDLEFGHRRCGDRRAASSTATCRARAAARADCSRCRAASAARGATDDVLVEDRDVVEPLEQVEGDVRLPLGRRSRRISPRSSWTPSACTSWPSRRERRDDVVLGAPRRRRRCRCPLRSCPAESDADGRAPGRAA